jgi:hypothetical protein
MPSYSEANRRSPWGADLMSGWASITFSLSILIVFVVSWLLKIMEFRHKYLEPSLNQTKTAEDLTRTTTYLGSVDLMEATSQTSTLSAVPNSPEIWIAFLIVATFLGSIVATRELILGRSLKSFALGFFYSSGLSSLSILAVDDLSDEAYLWANKVLEVSTSGVPGIRLWDGVLAESTVGTLQFLASAGILLLAPISIEVALLLPVLLSVFLCVWLMHITFIQVGSKLGSIVAPALVVTAPSLIFNASEAFDNVIGFSLVCSWAAIALREGLEVRKFLWLTSAASILAPMIRLELIVFSVLSMAVALIFFFSYLKSPREEDINKPIKNWLHPVGAIGLALFGVGLFFVWRLLTFGSLFPAMISYKSFNGDVWSLLMGAWTTLIAPWGQGASMVIALLLGFMFFSGIGLCIGLLWQFEKSVNIPKISVVLVPLMTLSVVSAVGAGGDYFPSSYLRYLITPTLTLFFVGLFLLFKTLAHKGSLGFPWVMSGAILALALPLYSNSNLVVADMGEVKLGRATCDAMAIKTFEALGEFEQNIPVIATTEINGAAYHSGARLYDLMGLADPRLFPEDSAYPVTARSLPDLYKFNHFEKYSFAPPRNEISEIDYVWIWGSTSCDVIDETALQRSSNLTKNDLVSRVFSSLNSPVTEYRVGRLETYLANGFYPVSASFRFTFNGEEYYGSTFMLRHK